MACVTGASQAFAMLRDYEDTVAGLASDVLNKFEVLGHLQLIARAWKGEHVRSGRESDASDGTRRQGSPTSSLATGSGAKIGSEQGAGRTTPQTGEKKKLVLTTARNALKSGEQGTASSAPTQEARAQPGQAGGAGRGLEASTWAAKAQEGDKKRPGDVWIQVKRSNGPRTKGGPRVGPALGTANLPRGEGQIRAVIAKEVEWSRRADMRPEELMEEIRRAAGDGIANLIRAVRVYRGGDIKITPRVGARTTLVSHDTWLKKWIQSAEFRGVVYPVVVHRLDARGTADETAERLQKENEGDIPQLGFQRAMWLKKTEGLKWASLKVEVTSPKAANRMIINGVALDYRQSGVHRFKKYGGARGGNPLYSDPEDAERSQSDSDSSQGMILDFGARKDYGVTSSQSTQVRKRMGEALAPVRALKAKGRPPGSVNKPKQLGSSSQGSLGSDPFKMAGRVGSSAPIEEGAAQVVPPNSGSEADAEMDDE